jgi:hypothetical protein
MFVQEGLVFKFIATKNKKEQQQQLECKTEWSDNYRHLC